MRSENSFKKRGLPNIVKNELLQSSEKCGTTTDRHNSDVDRTRQCDHDGTANIGNMDEVSDDETIMTTYYQDVLDGGDNNFSDF